MVHALGMQHLPNYQALYEHVLAEGVIGLDQTSWMRLDDKSGKPFVLHKAESLAQRVGILVHKGDVQQGQVARRDARFVAGEL